MALNLTEFNHSELFPTLKSFVDSFKGGWIDQIDFLRSASQIAKDKVSSLESCPWAVMQMIKLFDRQIELLLSVKQTEIYRWESGAAQNTFQVPEYTKVLECIHAIGKMFERLPNTYKDKDEESLRDHMLVSLEGVVFGTATGETFNKRGKTDILVRGNGCNEFVGECKFWNGKEAFLGTLSQLLSYLSWRDTKTAVILFVKNLNFTDVILKVKKYIAEHPNFLRYIDERDETWLNYEFRMTEDTARVVTLAVMLYHLSEAND